MKTLRLITLFLCAASLSGCGMLDAARIGTALDGTVCSVKNQLEARQRLVAILTLMPEGSDKQKARDAMAIAGVSATALCELARSLEGSVFQTYQ